MIALAKGLILVNLWMGATPLSEAPNRIGEMLDFNPSAKELTTLRCPRPAGAYVNTTSGSFIN
jgi:hypothetical protein